MTEGIKCESHDLGRVFSFLGPSLYVYYMSVELGWCNCFRIQEFYYFSPTGALHFKRSWQPMSLRKMLEHFSFILVKSK